MGWSESAGTCLITLDLSICVFFIKGIGQVSDMLGGNKMLESARVSQQFGQSGMVLTKHHRAEVVLEEVSGQNRRPL